MVSECDIDGFVIYENYNDFSKILKYYLNLYVRHRILKDMKSRL